MGKFEEAYLEMIGQGVCIGRGVKPGTGPVGIRMDMDRRYPKVKAGVQRHPDMVSGLQVYDAQEMALKWLKGQFGDKGVRNCEGGVARRADSEGKW